MYFNGVGMDDSGAMYLQGVAITQTQLQVYSPPLLYIILPHLSHPTDFVTDTSGT